MLTPEELNLVGPCPRKASQISRALHAIQDSDGDPESDAGSQVQVRPIQSESELDRVYRLTHDAYVERGYCAVQPDGRLIHYPHLDRIPETSILVALLDGEIVGTNSWTLDGPHGLHVDEDFKTECDVIRREGKRLAASWRIATKSSYRGERKVVMGLIQETINSFLRAGVSTSVFTFNPRHERIYQRLLNMRTIALSAGTQGLQNAPAVFMRMDTATIPERWLHSKMQDCLKLEGETHATTH